MVIKKGGIYIAQISYTDLTAYKERPIVIIDENSFGEYLYFPLTTNLQRTGLNLSSTDCNILFFSLYVLALLAYALQPSRES